MRKWTGSILRPLEPAKESALPLVAFDCENDTKTGLMTHAAVYGFAKDHHGVVKEVGPFYTDKQIELENFIKRLAARKRFILVGFMVDYDLTYIEGAVDTASKLYAGSRFITAVLKAQHKKGGNMKVIDLANLVDGSLSSWEKILKIDVDLSLKDRIDLTPDEWKQRGIDDAKATWVLGDWLQGFFKGLGMNLPLTIGQAALKNFQINWLDRTIYRKPEDCLKFNNLERESYRGGRVEVFRQGVEVKTYNYDVNALYLSVMERERFPVPNRARLYRTPRGDLVEKILAGSMLFIIKGTVHVPDQDIPPLPVKAVPPGGSEEKLLFPVGWLKGAWCSCELLESLKHGVTVEEVEWIIVYTESRPFFHRVCAGLWSQRWERQKEYGKDGVVLMIKKLGNSLYGKLAQQSGGGGHMCTPEDLPDGITDFQFMKDDNYVVYIDPTDVKEDSEHTFPCIASFVSAYARVVLLKRLKQTGKDACYCDTDSVKSLRVMQHNKDLGEWGAEGFGNVIFFGPKTYGIVKKGSTWKELKAHRKGVGKAWRLVFENDKEERWEGKRPVKWKSQARRGIHQNIWLLETKTISKTDSKRKWLSGGYTEPWRVDLR